MKLCGAYKTHGFELIIQYNQLGFGNDWWVMSNEKSIQLANTDYKW